MKIMNNNTNNDRPNGTDEPNGVQDTGLAEWARLFAHHGGQGQ